MMGGHEGFGLLGGGIMWVFWILLIILAGIIVKASLWGCGDRAGVGHKERSALETLKQRYARGEIDQDEFEHKRKDLIS